MEESNESGFRRGEMRIYVLWAVLALPGLYLIVQRVTDGKIAYLYWTGFISCLLLILTMMITPLMQLLGPLPWFKARRRYFGVASFGYAALHTAFWLVNAHWGSLISSFFQMRLLTGWIALAIMIPLALTSFDSMVRKFGRNWKTIQRWVYPAAVVTLLHWIMTTDNKPEALMWCLPLILLEIYRVVRYRRRMALR